MIAIDQPPELTLNADEIRFVMAYRTMDDRRRAEVMGLAIDEAAHHPRRITPALRLLTGGAA